MLAGRASDGTIPKDPSLARPANEFWLITHMFGDRLNETPAYKVNMSAPPAIAPPNRPRSYFSEGSPSPQSKTSISGDDIFRWICQAAAGLVIFIPTLLLVILVWKSMLAITEIGFQFLITTRWDPVHREFGSLAFIYGTLVTSAIAMAIAVPLGLGTAVFLSEIAQGTIRKIASFFIEMLAAIPSVVYGFWGIYVLAPILGELGIPNGGVGIIAASLVLSIMIVPYIAAISYDVCQAVPRSQREGSLALGATRWQTISRVVVPYARPGIVGGCFLALGRALGETMAVTMLIGNKAVFPSSLLDFPRTIFGLGNSIPSVIALEYVEAPFVLYRSVLAELALLLLLVTVVINSLARLMILRVAGGRRPKARLSAIAVPSAPVPDDIRPSPRPTPRMQSVKEHFTYLSARTKNIAMTAVLGGCMVFTMGMLVVILAYLVTKGASALNWDFFTKLPDKGMANGIVGSLEIVGLSTLFAVPVGLLAAIYLAEYRSNQLSISVRFVGELLGGVPSIIVGIFAAALFDMLTNCIDMTFHPDHQYRFYGWSGIFALCVMMVPIVMRASEEALKLVPQALRNASYALGATQWQTVLRVTVPAALPAIVTAIFLAIARIAGETAPLLMTAGMSRLWPDSLGDFTPSLPVFIFQYAGSPDPALRTQAWAAAFVLMVIVIVLNFGIRFATGKRVVLASQAE